MIAPRLGLNIACSTDMPSCCIFVFTLLKKSSVANPLVDSTILEKAKETSLSKAKEGRQERQKHKAPCSCTGDKEDSSPKHQTLHILRGASSLSRLSGKKQKTE